MKKGFQICHFTILKMWGSIKILEGSGLLLVHFILNSFSIKYNPFKKNYNTRKEK